MPSAGNNGENSQQSSTPEQESNDAAEIRAAEQSMDNALRTLQRAEEELLILEANLRDANEIAVNDPVRNSATNLAESERLSEQNRQRQAQRDRRQREEAERERLHRASQAIRRYREEQRRRRCLSDRERVFREERAEDREELFGVQVELSYEGLLEMKR